MAFAGTAKILVDGVELAESAGTAKLEPGGTFGRTKMTGTKILGSVPGQIKPGAVEGTFSFETAKDAVKVLRAKSVTIIFKQDNGDDWVVAGAAQVGETPSIEEDDTNGMQTTGVRFEGQPAEPVG